MNNIQTNAPVDTPTPSMLISQLRSFLPIEATRESIEKLEAAMVAMPESEKMVFENRHDFCPGVYARTIFMQAGMTLTSKIHKTQHFFVVSQGSCTVIDSHGVEQFISAPYLGVTMPGTKRALYIHEDCIWTTFHATHLTDPEAIGKEILADSFDDISSEVPS